MFCLLCFVFVDFAFLCFFGLILFLFLFYFCCCYGFDLFLFLFGFRFCFRFRFWSVLFLFPFILISFLFFYPIQIYLFKIPFANLHTLNGQNHTPLLPSPRYRDLGLIGQHTTSNLAIFWQKTASFIEWTGFYLPPLPKFREPGLILSHT